MYIIDIVWNQDEENDLSGHHDTFVGALNLADKLLEGRIGYPLSILISEGIHKYDKDKKLVASLRILR